MTDLIDHSSDLRGVCMGNDLVESGQTEGLQGEPVLFRATDVASHQFDLDLLGHLSFLSGNLRDFLSPLLGDQVWSLKLAKSVKCGFDEVMGIVRPEGLGQNILDPSGIPSPFNCRGYPDPSNRSWWE